ncbi:MAG: hypothetical protein M3326_11945 [Actinomycetota bacterium]|nr:hypothetical protein [Actinomycetota bacterium]
MKASKGRIPLAFLGLVMAAGVVLTGCGSDDSDEATSAGIRSYVGTVQGTSALVAVVTDGSRALAYVCDGMPAEPQGTAPTIQTWFNGGSDGKAVDIQQGASRLKLQLTGSAMAGTVTLTDGRTLNISGVPVEGDAGLYRADTSGTAGKGAAGWILAADGQQRGGFGDGITVKGVKTLTLSQPTFSLQGLASARIAKVGITPIPIP